MPYDTDLLLKEAIADAKLVRETAMANAKLTLEEEFKPHLSSMLSSKLRKEIEGDISETINPGSSGIGGSSVTVDDPGPTKPSKDTSSASGANGSGSEVEPFGEGPVVEGDLGIGGDDHMEHDGHYGDNGGGGEIPGEHDAGDPGLENDVLDLESIIRELELDIQQGEHGHGEEHQMHDHPEGVQEDWDDPMAGAKVDGWKTGVTKESTNGANDKDGPSMPAKDGVNGGKEVKPGQEVSAPGDEDKGGKSVTMSEDMDLDEILREMEAEDEGSVDESEKIATENVELKESLQKHRDVIQYLRKQLQETHMMNAKLLYTNKLFKGFELNGKQKMHVVETFDRATTLREVKLIYTTLAESLGGKVSKTGKAVSKTITEGMASRPIASTKPKSPVSEQLDESDELRKRMMKLAGIQIL